MFTTSNLLIESWKISWFDEAQAKFMKSRMEPRKGALRMIYSCKVMQHCHWSFDYVKKYKRNAFLWEDKTKALKSDSLCKFLNIFIIIPSFIEKRRKKKHNKQRIHVKLQLHFATTPKKASFFSTFSRGRRRRKFDKMHFFFIVHGLAEERISYFKHKCRLLFQPR